MNNRFKLAVATSVVALTTAACAPNPYWQYPGASGSAASTNRALVSHSHCGKTHAHALPPQGLAHHHGDGCMGSGGAQAAQSSYAPAYRPPVTNNNTYQPSSNSGSSNTYGYNDYNNNNTGSNNSNYGYGSNSSSGGSYYDYSAPKQSGNTSGSSNSYYDYSSGNSNGSSSSSGSYYDYNSSSSSSSSSSSKSGTSTGGYSSGGSYTVQKGDTVFQVMRTTGVYWKDIIRLNNLQAPDYKLTPGQQLRIK